MSPEERRRRGTKLCAKIAADVKELAPTGIGSWPGCWEIVDGADAQFMIALTAWEADPTADTQARTKAAYNAVLDAWREAAHQFEEQGQRAS